jgi:hypothetical protein
VADSDVDIILSGLLDGISHASCKYCVSVMKKAHALIERLLMGEPTAGKRPAVGGIVVLKGVLGWGNRKGGLEAYGPGGRWEGEGHYSDHGDLLGDALDRAGASEGATLLVVAVPRFGDTSILDRVAKQVAPACTHPRRTFTIGGPEDSDGYVWCPDCRTNLSDDA